MNAYDTVSAVRKTLQCLLFSLAFWGMFRVQLDLYERGVMPRS